jgi:hypothetical protein
LEEGSFASWGNVNKGFGRLPFVLPHSVLSRISKASSSNGRAIAPRSRVEKEYTSSFSTSLEKTSSSNHATSPLDRTDPTRTPIPTPAYQRDDTIEPSSSAADADADADGEVNPNPNPNPNADESSPTTTPTRFGHLPRMVRTALDPSRPGRGSLPFVWQNDVPRGLLEMITATIQYALMYVSTTPPCPDFLSSLATIPGLTLAHAPRASSFFFGSQVDRNDVQHLVHPFHRRRTRSWRDDVW